MKYILFFLYATLITQYCNSESIYIKDQGEEYIIPKNSYVNSFTITQDNIVNFKGQFTVAGKYVYGYTLRDKSNIPTDELELHFYPQQKSALRLPFLKRTGVATEVGIANPEEFIDSVVTSEQLKKLHSKKSLSVTGNVSILVSSYQAQISCDFPVYMFEFVALKNIFSSAFLANGFPESYC